MVCVLDSFQFFSVEDFRQSGNWRVLVFRRLKALESCAFRAGPPCPARPQGPLEKVREAQSGSLAASAGHGPAPRLSLHGAHVLLWGVPPSGSKHTSGSNDAHRGGRVTEHWRGTLLGQPSAAPAGHHPPSPQSLRLCRAQVLALGWSPGSLAPRSSPEAGVRTGLG